MIVSKNVTLSHFFDIKKSMRRISDTELIRNYCEKNKGDILDINYASENIFVDIPHVNLRKIASRLIDSGLLRTISKGVRD